ncbi:bifunctional diguanylate cyclase/phosphodiesterase [Mitsuaria sp. GD03876]|uniref:putative bifunctional diguanylate cyclase/phosphodiesterase n=1 Tax=Mitsuaria sp. GD03876 TaxID=2975399 RepID=UPI0024492DFF|nr:bifunctional diguanylate cyclase/phosphodiesterase [Mitsuaria sp. GD03876]MDH0867858.1 bifunctional diguanylate cyclase/phosphodiesterase [Mitsuaria sp. GD03876]
MLWVLLGVLLGVALTLVLLMAVQGRLARAGRRRARDRLTGLPTSRRFEDEFATALEALQRRAGEGCLLYIGLDGFRLVNDEHGKANGDHLLVRTAERLRQIGGKRALVGRLAGDEFALWSEVPAGQTDALVRQVLEALTEPVVVGATPLRVGLSVGVAMSPEHGGSIRLIRRAQTAMRSVKRLGGNGHAFFDAVQEEELREELTLARELREAIRNKELELLYQPKMDAGTLQVTGVEALLRWRHPTLGMVSPARFIPVAERYGLIETIGDWVGDTALAQAARWREMGLRMRVAINVSGYQMRSDDFISRLEKGLKRHRLRPERFTCEITESVAMEHTAATGRAFKRLGALGVHVSIDDFGTGYSSLAALRQLPAQELKIDRAFVADVATSVEAQAIARAVIEMARVLHLKVVAEGVETAAQRDQLVAMGCDELQGFLFAKPMSARAIEVLASEAGKVPSGGGEGFRPSIFVETAAVPLDARR